MDGALPGALKCWGAVTWWRMSTCQKLERAYEESCQTGAAAHGRATAIYSNLTGRELLKKPSPHSKSPACACHWHSPTRSQRAKKPTDEDSLLARSTVKDGEWVRRGKNATTMRNSFHFHAKVHQNIYVERKKDKINNFSIKKHYQWYRKWGEVPSLWDRLKGPSCLMFWWIKLPLNSDAGLSRRIPQGSGSEEVLMFGRDSHLSGWIDEVKVCFKNLFIITVSIFLTLLPARSCVKSLKHIISFNTLNKTWTALWRNKQWKCGEQRLHHPRECLSRIRGRRKSSKSTAWVIQSFKITIIISISHF